MRVLYRAPRYGLLIGLPSAYEPLNASVRVYCRIAQPGRTYSLGCMLFAREIAFAVQTLDADTTEGVIAVLAEVYAALAAGMSPAALAVCAEAGPAALERALGGTVGA